MAADHVISGSLVEWKIVSTVNEARVSQRLRRQVGRRVGKQRPIAAGQMGDAILPQNPGQATKPRSREAISNVAATTSRFRNCMKT